jgi:uracil permease
MSEEAAKPQTELVYGPDDKPRSTRDAIVYSLQWILIMFYPVVWGYSIVGINIGFTSGEMAAYMSRVVLMIGVSTLIQVLAGHKFSMISGPNIIPSVAILAAFAIGGKENALQAFNAYIIAGVVVAAIGALGWFNYLSKVWTPLALGAMIMMVGLSTSGVGVGLVAAQGFSWTFIVGVNLALLCGWLSIQGKGMLATIPVMIVIALGYVIFIATGNFDWQIVDNMPAVSVPSLFPYGWQMPSGELILTMIIVNLFSAINLYGNTNGYAGIVGRPLTPADEKRTFIIFGLLEGTVCSILGVPSHVAYGENLGFVLLTRVASRFFMIIAAIAFIIFGFSGKFSGLMAAMPKEVAGAVLMGVASTLIGLAASTWCRGRTFQTREIFITGFSVFLAFGLANLPDAFYSTLPDLVGMLFKNAVIMVIILVIVLEQVLFPLKKTEG